MYVFVSISTHKRTALLSQSIGYTFKTMVALGRANYLALLLFKISFALSAETPNIIFIFADDLGWNHVSWNNPSVLSPNLQKLADTGVILNQSYVQPLCTPSRSALMTGMYPFHLGRQHDVLTGNMPTGLDRDYTLLPEKLSNLGYSTHMVGKWHLGMCDWSYTPTYRGFDSFYGYYSGAEWHYSHNTSDHGKGGFDFRDDERVALETADIYATDLYTSRAVQIIEDHEIVDNPFFLYFAHQNIHDPYEVPDEYYDLYPDVGDENTRIALGMVSAMDESVGDVVDALKRTSQFRNTIIIFSSDNGAERALIDGNSPLRGNKAQLWEGGTRSAGVIHSPLLQGTPRVHQGLMHVTDWYNTLLDIAGEPNLPDNDGFSQWEALRNEQESSPRNTLIYNLDDAEEDLIGAIRVGDYKYVTGQIDPATHETGPWLFNLSDDPSESKNLVSDEPIIAAELEDLLLSELTSLVPADNPPNDPAGDPANWGGVVSPGWCASN